MLMKIALTAAALALAPTLALAQTGQPAPKAETPNIDVIDKKPEEDKVVCRTEEVTGARARKTRVCKPMSEWDPNSRLDNGRFVRDLYKDRENQLAPRPSGG